MVDIPNAFLYKQNFQDSVSGITRKFVTWLEQNTRLPLLDY
jgi:hypothetical protein